MTQQQLLGAINWTGIFISKEDLNQLIEVIAKAKAKDNFIKKAGIGVMGGGGTGGEVTMGSLSIEHFCQNLAKAYGFKDTDKRKYGVDEKGQLGFWMTPAEIAGQS